MTGKAKPKKHTAKELQAKADAALTNRGGGKAGLADRTGKEKGGHAKYECPHCKITAPDLKTMQIHHESKHPKLPYEEPKNLHEALAAPESSKPKPGIRGSLKKWLCLYWWNYCNKKDVILKLLMWEYSNDAII